MLSTLNYHWQSKRLSFHRRRAQHDFGIFRSFVDYMNAAGHPVRGERVLDVGCGFRFPTTLLMHTFGAKVTGIDLDFAAPQVPLSNLLADVRDRGLMEGARRFVRELYYKPVYFKTLEQEMGNKLNYEGLDLRRVRIEDFQAEGEFDIVFSNHAFEHLADVDGAVRTISRSLKPQGLAYIAFHLFTSLTGGHDVMSIHGTPTVFFRSGGYPWRHLRDAKWRPSVYLNRWREHQYRETFEKHMRVLDWRGQFWEPEEFLTDTTLRSLQGYSRDELLKRTLLVVAAPKVNA